MANEVLIALVTGASVVAGSALTAFFNHRSIKATTDLSNLERKLVASRKELVRAYRQIAAYHQLEDIVAQEQAASVPGLDYRAVKKGLRDKVEESGLDRPEMTRRQSESRIREIETEA